MKKPTLDQLTIVGSEACCRAQLLAGESPLVEMSPGGSYYGTDKKGREAFAAAVAKAATAPLLAEIAQLKKAKPPAKDPETFTCHGLIWIKHKPEDPMPCPQALRVRILTANEKSGDRYDASTGAADEYIWGVCGPRIVGWYPAEPKATKEKAKTPRRIPLDHNDIRAVDEFKIIDTDTVRTVFEWSKDGIRLGGIGSVPYSQLAANYLRRQHGSSEWLPCTKEA